MTLAHHLEDRHLNTQVRVQTANHPVSRIPLQSTSATLTEERPAISGDVITATTRTTGHTTAQEKPAPAHQGPIETAADTAQEPGDENDYTVKYLFAQFLSIKRELKSNADFDKSNHFVVDNLRSHLSFWKSTLRASNFVLNVIEYGYLIPFFESPTSKIMKNNSSAITHKSFVTSAINRLLETGVIIDCHNSPPFVVNPLTVSVNANGKERLILDLRHVNRFIERRKFKFEGVSEAIQFISSSGYCFKFDLKSAYHNIVIHEDHRKFLGFAWDFPEGTRYFTFKCLPFGLSVAAYAFSKVLRPLVKYWRSFGYRMVLYLDDGWGFENSYHSCKIIADKVREHLSLAGLFINQDKSIWEPTQRLTWLGFTWDLSALTLEIPQVKLLKFREIISNILDNLEELTPRKLARIP